LLLLAGCQAWSPVDAAEDACAEELVIVFGSSPHRQCVAEILPEFADYEFDDCTLSVYLTDLTKSETAEAILGPFLEAELANCPPRASRRLEFREAKYPYLDLARWEAEGRERLIGKNAGVRSVELFGRQISSYVTYDATIAEVTEVFTDIGIPEDAFTITSRETELREQPSVAPSVRATPSGQQLVLPAVLLSNDLAGELVLGHSTLGEVEKMLPAWPGYGPSRPSGEIHALVSDEMRRILDDIRWAYNPRASMIIVGFDRKRRLISVQYALQEGQDTPVDEALNELATLREVYRSEDLVLRRGRLGECVIVETGSAPDYETKEFVLGSVIYLYACDPD
jgi:hypothetical protein